MPGRLQPPRVRLSGLTAWRRSPYDLRSVPLIPGGDFLVALHEAVRTTWPKPKLLILSVSRLQDQTSRIEVARGQTGLIDVPATCKHSSMSVGSADSRYMSLAWLVLALALALRLVFFVGYGLGDDSNESTAVGNFARTLRLYPWDFMDYRVMDIVPRGLVYRFFGPSELAFILPILVMALGTHGASIVFARELLGTRAAFFTSVAFLVTPYETLASTANVPDYALAFFGVVAAWAALRGYRRGSPGYMAVAACCIGLAFLNRMAAILLLPPFAVATLGTLRLWRCWLSFWGTLVGIFALFCVADFYYSGSPYRWVWFNSAGGVGGHDVTDILGYVLMIYPRYLFGQDDFRNRMFGLTAWCGVLGVALALGRVVARRASTAEWVLLIAFFVFGGMFEFLPHKLTLRAYWSHPRIFRYLATVAPVFYLNAGYFLDRTWDLRLLRSPLRLGPIVCAAMVAVGLQQTPRVIEPLADSSRDGRRLLAWLPSQRKSTPVPLYSDSWRIAWIRALYPKYWEAWTLHGVVADTRAKKVHFLQAVPPGALVITGGATLPWYSGIDLIVSLSRLSFTVPPNWTLLQEFDGKRAPWRAEPLRVWSVGPPVAAGG